MVPWCGRPSTIHIDTRSITACKATFPSVVRAGATEIDAGNDHSMVLKQDGSVWATGSNEYGQLGDGTTTIRLTFVKVVSSGPCGTMVCMQ